MTVGLAVNHILSYHCCFRRNLQSFNWARLVLPTLARDARVYALDLRGHGNSDRPKKGYQIRDLAADVLAFMDAKGIVRATIVGHSLGGFIAQQVALAAPRRVSQLVLVGTATTPRNPGLSSGSVFYGFVAIPWVSRDGAEAVSMLSVTIG